MPVNIDAVYAIAILGVLDPVVWCFTMSKSLSTSMWGPTVYPVEWSVSSYAILFRIDGERRPLGVLVPIFLMCVHDVHFQSSRQGMYHSFCCSIRLGSICHSSTLFLPRDPVERLEEIGHETWLSIMADRSTGPKSSEQTLLVTLVDRL